MAEQPRKRYQLGGFQLEPDTQQLQREGQPVHLANLPFQVLLYLLENRDRVVSRAELLERYWAGRDVYDDALRKAVGAIRRAFDDAAEQPRFIETRRAGGYRYIGPCEVVAQEEEVERLRVVRVVIEEEEVTESAVTPALALPQPRRGRWLGAAALALPVLLSMGWYAYRAASKPASALPRLDSIAVLPLRNLTGDAGQDLACEGVADILIGELSRARQLKVVARTSSFTFKGRDVDAREIGRQLGVATVLEGSLQQRGHQPRIEVRLINTADGHVLWINELKTQDVRDLFAVQAEIACSVANSLQLLLCNEREQAAARRTANPLAAQAYLRGRALWYKRDVESMRQALVEFEHAAQADPQFALAYSGLAETHGVMQINRQVPPNSVTAKAKAYARQALALDPALGRAYAIQGLLTAFIEWNWAEGERLLQQASQFDPNDAYAYAWHANVLLAQGRFAEAEQALLRAQEHDPLSLSVINSLGEVYRYWGKSDRMLEQAQRLVARDSQQNFNARMLFFQAYVMQGRYDEAVRWVENGEITSINRLALLLAQGKKNEAAPLLNDLTRSALANISPAIVAANFALAGDKDTTFAWLERAYTQRESELSALKIEPNFAGLRDDPRYHSLLQRVGLAP